MSRLVTMKGDGVAGAKIYETLCSNCHQARGKGKDFGPNLSEIGDKLGRDALFLSVLDPNAGVSFNYEGTGLGLRSGDEVVGIVVSETDDSITLKTTGAIVTTYPKNRIRARRKLNVSIMPADLQRSMTVEELVDLVEYLSGLRK